MFRSALVKTVCCLTLPLAASACGDDPIETPINPDPVTYTENYSGSVNRNGAVSHSFFTTLAGEVTATLTNLTPDGLTIGLMLGTWNGTICAVQLPNDKAVKSTVIVGTASTAASLCVRIYDVGNITDAEPAAYEITVVHR
jgi:hypothetical protein